MFNLKVSDVRNNSQQRLEAAITSRKLEFSGASHSAQSLRRTSESDTSSQRRRKADERRRSSRNLEKCFKLIPNLTSTSSSSSDDSDNEKELRNLLQQSQNRLEDTKALKIRCHLLRPEDYVNVSNISHSHNYPNTIIQFMIFLLLTITTSIAILTYIFHLI